MKNRELNIDLSQSYDEYFLKQFIRKTLEEQADRLEYDIEYLNGMRTLVEKLHEKQYDVSATEYLLQKIDGWIDELKDKLNYPGGK